MKQVIAVFITLVVLHTPLSFAQEAPPTPDTPAVQCGQIVTPDSYEDDGFREEAITDCANPFETKGHIPYEVRVNEELLLTGETIELDTRQWLYFEASSIGATFRLYKKVGQDYYEVIFANPFIPAYEEQFSDLEREALRKQYYAYSRKKVDFNIILQFFPSYRVFFAEYVEELNQYAEQSVLLGSGEYVLLSSEFMESHPTLAPLPRLFPTAYAAPMGDWYEVSFTVTVADEAMKPSVTALGPTFTLDPDYKAARLPTIRRNELGLQAADLATTVAGNADKYLWNGKGWDYESKMYVDSTTVLSNYRYWDVDTGRVENGAGLDCSGLITWAYNRSNNPTDWWEDNFIKYVNASGQFAEAQSDKVQRSQLLPGDTAAFDWDNNGSIDHTIMYVGRRSDVKNGEYNIVHAEGFRTGIVVDTLDNYLKIITPNSLKGYRRPHLGRVELQIKTLSPVNMIVRDPDGHILSYEDITRTESELLREIPGELYYSEMVQGHDGRPEDVVYAPYAKAGTYHIIVVPDETAEEGDTFSLEVTVQGQKKVIAQDVAIEDPEQPFAYEFYIEGEESAASRGEEESIVPDEEDDTGASGSEEIQAEVEDISSRSSGSSATRVGGRRQSGRVLGAATDYNVSILQGVFDYQKTLASHTWQVRSVNVSGVAPRVIFNQIASDTTEVLLINTTSGQVPLLQTVENNKLKTL